MNQLFQVSRRDLIVLVSFAVTLGALAGFSSLDSASKRKQLKEKASDHVTKFYEGLNPDEYEHLLEVVTGKSFQFIGKDWGVVRLYARHKGDATMNTFIGIEYFYHYEDAGWTLRDTAQIKEPVHIYEGYDAFERAGFGVDDEAYLRYSR